MKTLTRWCFSHIQKLFAEVGYWWRLSFECPHYVSKLYRNSDKLYDQRQAVRLVVQDYNR